MRPCSSVSGVVGGEVWGVYVMVKVYVQCHVMADASGVGDERDETHGNPKCKPLLGEVKPYNVIFVKSLGPNHLGWGYHNFSGQS